jgi:hypothetical protein
VPNNETPELSSYSPPSQNGCIPLPVIVAIDAHSILQEKVGVLEAAWKAQTQ